MIVGRSLPLEFPVISGLLLLDCWQISKCPVYEQEHTKNFYKNILLEIDSMPLICAISTLNRSDGNEIDPELSKEITKKTKLLHLNSTKDFVDSWGHKISQWYVVGQHWKVCVHNNAMGLYELIKLSQQYSINFYANEFSFLKNNAQKVSHDDFVQDAVPWEFLPRFGYKLIST